MAKVHVEREFPQSAATVWAWVGDTATVANWIPAIGESHMVEDIRHVTFTDGNPARERIVEHDDAKRRYTYEYLDGPLPLRVYRSTIGVADTAHGSKVVWSAEFSAESEADEPGLGTAIDGIYSDALTELATKLAGA
ncbi:SRPBCC family protein [Nocardia callitridis]|uniref:SRPBCC family protein n=1 Tax=Nocardia callitridis TaxID=648753 RepID=A0ABP9KMW6_9NOCA